MKTPSLAFFLTVSALMPAGLTSCSRDSIAADAVAPAGTTASAADSSADFVAAYTKALEAKDTATLDSWLITDGTPEEVVGFFKMMRDMSMTGKVKVELKAADPVATAKFNEPQEMPDGQYYKMPVTPTHLLVVSTESQNGSEGSSKSSSTFPVIQKDGKFRIPLPVPTEQKAK